MRFAYMHIEKNLAAKSTPTNVALYPAQNAIRSIITREETPTVTECRGLRSFARTENAHVPVFREYVSSDVYIKATR
jgi:hypothetical protein